MIISSKLIEKAIDQMATLPGIGRKTAMRLVLDLLKRSPDEVEKFSSAFTKMREGIQYCAVCYNLSDQELCSICSNHNRNTGTLCVVEDIRDVMAIESTQQFKGRYHVLGGKISPMDGIGPQDLRVGELVARITGREREDGREPEEVKEIILALSATLEGDTTNFFIYRKLKDISITISTLARGVGVGEELEYTDEITLGRSILNRTPFEVSLSR